MIHEGKSQDNLVLFLTTFNVDGEALLASFGPQHSRRQYVAQ